MKFLILGANSAMAYECAKIWSFKGDLVLVARDLKKLESYVAQLKSPNKVTYYAADLTDINSGEVLWNEILRQGPFDVVLTAHGLLKGENRAQEDFKTFMELTEVNFTSHVFWIFKVLKHFKEIGRGHLQVISSVAGDRGKIRSMVYSSGKAGLNIFVEGLSLKCRRDNPGIFVSLIKPGYTNTPMTEKLKKNFLFVSPTYIARSIDANLKNKKPIVYSPSYWLLITKIISNLPHFIYKHLKF